MNANCLDGNSNFKKCPFRIVERETKNVYGSHKEQNFRPCIGERCIAYHVGICLRLAEALKEVR